MHALRLLVPAVAALANVAHVNVAHAQAAVRGSLEAGAARLWQPTLATVTAPTVTGDVRYEARRLALHALGGAAFGGHERRSAQLAGEASWVALPRGRTALEVGGQSALLRFNGAPASTSAALLAREHVQLGRGGAWTSGVWGGAGLGMIDREVGPRASSTAFEGGAWLRRDRLRATMTLLSQRARLDTTDVPGLTPPVFAALDATVAADWRAPRFEVAATLGARRARRQSASLLGTAYATAAWWLLPSVGATLAGGDLSADPLRGFPRRRVASVGIRWRFGVPTPRAEPATVAEVTRRGGAAVLRLRVPNARQVEVRGDFTRWQAVALTRVGARWELPLGALPAGTVRLALRVDGGAWQMPDNLPAVEDEFGERSALLVVPDR